MKKAKTSTISITTSTIQFSLVYQRARRIQSKHNRQWSRSCSAPRCKLDGKLHRIVEWKITDVRCDIVLCLSLIMASNSYCCTKELHCGGWRDIPLGLCQFPLAQRHSSGIPSFKTWYRCSTGGWVSYREAPSEHSKPSYRLQYSRQRIFPIQTNLSLLNSTTPGNPIEVLRKWEMWPTGDGLVVYSKIKPQLYRTEQALRVPGV